MTEIITIGNMIKRILSYTGDVLSAQCTICHTVANFDFECDCMEDK